MKLTWDKLHYLWASLFLSLAISGSLTLNTWPLYIMVISICVCLGLIAFDKVPHKLYLPIIFSMSLALLYQTTLMSPGLVGTDVHGDFYYAWLTRSSGSWDWQLPETYNSSMSSALFAPVISWVFHIPIVWVFKAIYPFLLALVPPVLYFLYKEHISKQWAFLSCFFFIAVPTYMIELTSIPKQQVAEFFFVLCAFLVISEKLKLRWKPLWVVIAAFLFIVSHYSIFAIAMIYFVGAAALLLIFRAFQGKVKGALRLKYVIPVAAIVVILGCGYYSTVAEGRAWNALTGTYSSMTQQLNPPDADTGANAPIKVTPTPTPTVEPSPVKTATPTPAEKGKAFYLKRQGPMIKAALGLDFFDVSTTGKIFRILQFATQGLVILGVYRVIRTKGKGWSKPYLAFGIMSCVILALTIFYPKFSPVMNATRFYNLALIFLAPAIIIGGMWAFKKLGGVKTLVLCIFIPYFLFTSGFVFEATKDTTTEILDTPYTVAMSGTRVEVGGVMTANDMDVRDFIVYGKEGGYQSIYADLYGMYLLYEKAQWGDTVGEDVMKIFNRQTENVKDNFYIFLRERNVEEQELTFWLGVGLRTTMTFEELTFEERVLEGREVIYQCGNAMLLSPKR